MKNDVEYIHELPDHSCKVASPASVGVALETADRRKKLQHQMNLLHDDLQELQPFSLH